MDGDGPRVWFRSIIRRYDMAICGEFPRPTIIRKRAPPERPCLERIACNVQLCSVILPASQHVGEMHEQACQTSPRFDGGPSLGSVGYARADGGGWDYLPAHRSTPLFAHVTVTRLWLLRYAVGGSNQSLDLRAVQLD